MSDHSDATKPRPQRLPHDRPIDRILTHAHALQEDRLRFGTEDSVEHIAEIIHYATQLRDLLPPGIRRHVDSQIAPSHHRLR